MIIKILPALSHVTRSSGSRWPFAGSLSPLSVATTARFRLTVAHVCSVPTCGNEGNKGSFMCLIITFNYMPPLPLPLPLCPIVPTMCALDVPKLKKNPIPFFGVVRYS